MLEVRLDPPAAAAVAAPMEIAPPDLRPFARGAGGIPYSLCLASGRPGPTVVINALMHGNEFSGAIALLELLDRRIRPERGTLWLTFANVAAFAGFDVKRPFASRYVEEDMNRLWHRAVLDGAASTAERRRVRELWPLFAAADFLLDLHSMQGDSRPLLLAGLSPKGRELALGMRYPAVVVADAGHGSGTRLIDAEPFGGGRNHGIAVLLEAGRHWSRRSVAVAHATCLTFLEAAGTISARQFGPLLPSGTARAQQVIKVSKAVTVEHEPFTYTRPVRGLDVVPRAGTVIATDGPVPIRTPYDNCVLVLPTQTPRRGQTAVRLGRFVG
jgi:predicted deacylase